MTVQIYKSVWTPTTIRNHGGAIAAAHIQQFVLDARLSARSRGPVLKARTGLLIISSSAQRCVDKDQGIAENDEVIAFIRVRNNLIERHL